jgi:hypothetical protein
MLTGLMGALLGGLSNTTAARTTTNTQTFTPQQRQLQSGVISTIGQNLANPNAEFAPVEAAGLSAIDQSNTGLLDQMERELASRGFSNSGVSGANLEQILANEAGQKANFEGQLAGQKIGQQNQNIAQAMGAAFNPVGSTTVGPGSVAGGALGGGLAALMESVNQGIQADNGGNGGGGGN